MSQEMNSLQFGEFTLDCRLRELRRGDAPISIPGKAFDLLAYMAANAGRPLTKGELLDAVWPGTAVEESNLSQNVFLLRKVLGSNGNGPIKTLAGRGYQFAAEVTVAVPDRLPALAPLSSAAPFSTLTVETTETRVSYVDRMEEQTSSGPRWRGWGLVAAGLLVGLFTVGLIAVGWRARQRWLDRSGGSPVQVVLTAMDGTTGDPVLDRSLVQAMRMDLAQSPYVFVVPVSSVAARLTEMHRTPDDLSLPAVSREVCERSNSQAVLSGSLAKVGRHFLITEEATNCVDGSVMGQAKYEADSAEDLPRGIDSLAAALRRELGESRRSIARFNTPLFAQNTSSLEALKAYTRAVEFDRKGDSLEAIPLFKRAIAADPGFAWAWYSLALSSSNAGDFEASREASARAYSLRDNVQTSQAFAITALYHALVTQDLYESLRTYQAWGRLYPNVPSPWNGQAYVEGNLGHFAEEVENCRRALALAPENGNYLNELVQVLMQSGDPQAAEKAFEHAVALHLDDNFMRERSLEVAYLLGDKKLLQAQRQWENAHPGTAIVLVGEMSIAMLEGRFSDARKLVTRYQQLYREQGDEGAGDQFTKLAAVQFMEAGELLEGKRLFAERPANLEEGEQILGLAYAGDLAAAQSAIRTMQAKYPKGTLWHLYWGPLVQAVVALQQNKPQEAASVLEAARPLENRELIVPWVRGNAHLAAGQPALAEADYRDVVTHPERDATGPAISLSWLGLGEALAAQGKKQEAVEAYRHFFTLWSHADPDANNLKRAKQEFAALGVSLSSTQ